MKILVIHRIVVNKSSLTFSLLQSFSSKNRKIDECHVIDIKASETKKNNNRKAIIQCGRQSMISKSIFGRLCWNREETHFFCVFGDVYLCKFNFVQVERSPDDWSLVFGQHLRWQSKTYVQLLRHISLSWKDRHICCHHSLRIHSDEGIALTVFPFQMEFLITKLCCFFYFENSMILDAMAAMKVNRAQSHEFQCAISPFNWKMPFHSSWLTLARSCDLRIKISWQKL